MFRLFSPDQLRRRRPEAEGNDGGSANANDDDDDDKKKPKAFITNSADPARKPDVFDTHVGPALEKFALWCQKKGPLGWIAGILGVGVVTLVVGVLAGGAGYLMGNGIVFVLDKAGLLEQLRAVLASLDRVKLRKT